MARTKWSKDLIIHKIQELHKSGSELNSTYVTKKHRMLMWAATRYFHTWQLAVEASGIDYQSVCKTKIPEPWSEDKVIAEIRDMDAAGKPLNSNHIQQNHQNLYGAAIRYFKSWNNAIEAACLDTASIRARPFFRKRTKSRVTSEIQARQENGLLLNSGIVCKEDPTLYAAARGAFEGVNPWRQALTAAGVDPDSLPDLKTIWTQELVEETITTRYVEGLPLNIRFVNDSKNGLRGFVGAAKRYFGNWQSAIESCGIDYAEVKLTRSGYWTKEKIISKIQKLEKAGVPLDMKSMRSGSSKTLVAAALHHFGNWGMAVEAAGIDYQKHCRVWSTRHWLKKMQKTEYEDLVTGTRVQDRRTSRRSQRKFKLERKDK